jgi:hypothetical protein
MRRFLISAFVFILILALTIVSTILGVNLHNSNGRLATVETKLSNLEALLGDVTDEGEPIALPDFSKFATEKCNNTDSDGSLIVLYPCNGSVVGDKVTVHALAKGFFENNISVIGTTDDESVTFPGVLYPSSEIGQPGMVIHELDLSDFRSGDEVTLKFFEQSPRDGSEQKVVRVDVVIE